jgi:hypothetical protein
MGPDTPGTGQVGGGGAMQRIPSVDGAPGKSPNIPDKGLASKESDDNCKAQIKNHAADILTKSKQLVNLLPSVGGQRDWVKKLELAVNNLSDVLHQAEQSLQSNAPVRGGVNINHTNPGL